MAAELKMVVEASEIVNEEQVAESVQCVQTVIVNWHLQRLQRTRSGSSDDLGADWSSTVLVPQ